MYYPYYFDPTYFLVIIGVIICALASAKVNSTYARYDQVRNHAGITGAMAAEQILRMEGIYDVQVMRVSGKLTDHYDPANHVLRLSDSTYGSTSVAALGVAAHECGHAIQHARHYVPLSTCSGGEFWIRDFMAADHNGIIYQRRNVYIVYQSWDPDVFIGSAVPDHHASGRV